MPTYNKFSNQTKTKLAKGQNYCDAGIFDLKIKTLCVQTCP